MPAMHLRRVLLPDPLRPTMPKNSPGSTANDTSFRALKWSYDDRRNGCIARSLSVETRSCGIRNVFETPSTATAGVVAVGPAIPRIVGIRTPHRVRARERWGPLLLDVRRPLRRTLARDAPLARRAHAGRTDMRGVPRRRLAGDRRTAAAAGRHDSHVHRGRGRRPGAGGRRTRAALAASICRV